MEGSAAAATEDSCARTDAREEAENKYGEAAEMTGYAEDGEAAAADAGAEPAAADALEEEGVTGGVSTSVYLFLFIRAQARL